jgi:hypothetical protein
MPVNRGLQFFVLMAIILICSAFVFNARPLFIIGGVFILFTLGGLVMSHQRASMDGMKEIMREIFLGFFGRAEPPPKGRLIVEEIQKREGSSFYGVKYRHDATQAPISPEVADIMIRNAPSQSEREKIKRDIEQLNAETETNP